MAGKQDKVKSQWWMAWLLALAGATPSLPALAQPTPEPPETKSGEGQRPAEADIFAAPVETGATEAVTERPAEDQLFGNPEASPPAAPQGAPSRDERVLGDPGAAPTLSSEAAPEDPLQIGGQLFWQARSSSTQGQSVDEWSFSSPAILDVYMDARANEGLRGFVQGRMLFDPTLPTSREAAQAELGGMEVSGATMGTAPLSSLFAPQTRGPRAFLDQMWLRWNIADRVFLSAGKQHVRWGTGRFWMPTDFLHLRFRNPLDVFDARTGTTMLKVHVPWEDRGWNFYAFAVLEDETSTRTLGRVAGAARAEIVAGPMEVAGGVFLREGEKPKLAADFSTGVWDIDLYGELALRYGDEIDRVRFPGLSDGLAPAPRPEWQSPAEYEQQLFQQRVERAYPSYRSSGIKPQATLGFTYQRRYNDNDTWIAGVEYFYNGLGYDTPEAYPGLVLPRTTALVEPATFFYLGRHYGAVFLSLPAPYSWNYSTFTLSTIGNLSDQSFISRFDYSVTVVTHLQIQSFVSVRYGRKEGEFRFGVDDFMLGEQKFSLPPAQLDVGIALRIQI